MATMQVRQALETVVTTYSYQITFEQTLPESRLYTSYQIYICVLHTCTQVELTVVEGMGDGSFTL